MANNSSDSSHAATNSDNDSDHPRTPPLPPAAAPRSRTNTGRSFTAASKIPKLRTASVSKVQAPVSPPRTPADRDTAPAALDWGSGGEWSALIGEVRRSAAEMEGEAVDDDGLPVEVSEEKEEPLLQPTMASSGLFDEFEHSTASLKGPFDSIQPKEVSDDDDPLIVFEDADQQGGEGGGEEVHGGVTLEGESSDATASQTSDSEHSDLHASSALKEKITATESFDGSSDDEELPVVSVMKGSERHITEPHGPQGSAGKEAYLAGADASQTSGSESDTHPTSDPKKSGDISGLEIVGDDADHSVTSASKDVHQPIPEQQHFHENAMEETEFSDADTSLISGFNWDMHVISEPKQSGKSGHLENTSNDARQPCVSASRDVAQPIFEQQDLYENVMQEKGPSDADVCHASDSDVSEMELPAAIIRGPFLNLMDRRSAAESRASVAPELVLRGLIRDAHPETIHFTLPHSSFSPDDLRGGLQYAYSMLQAATSKLALLELLDNETTSMTGADLRRWIALADNSNPRANAKPRISVIFESLSIREMKAALEELVQSRLVVEGEVEKTRMSLLSKVVAKERQESSVVVPVKRAADFDKGGGSSSKKRRVSEEDNETLFDAFLTAIMVLLIGVLYLYVRE